MSWIVGRSLVLLLLLGALFFSVSSATAAVATPEAQERSIVTQLHTLVVPAPAGWEIIRDYPRYLRLEAKLAKVRYVLYNPWGAIAYVFGPYAGQANAVSSCESGHSIWAQNGQFLGLFQMGSHERATYGHGSYALAQVRAAFAYFVASGRDWSPWQCKP